MKEEAQRIAIAEACGWTWTDKVVCLNGRKQWPRTNLAGCRAPLEEFFPDYLRDLNAMHEAECSGAFNIPDYVRNLAAALGADTSEGWAGAGDWFIMLHATAAQRAEAFLRAIGKWVEK